VRAMAALLWRPKAPHQTPIQMAPSYGNTHWKLNIRSFAPNLSNELCGKRWPVRPTKSTISGPGRPQTYVGWKTPVPRRQSCFLHGWLLTPD
jgi:hypothetical protein